MSHHRASISWKALSTVALFALCTTRVLAQDVGASREQLALLSSLRHSAEKKHVKTLYAVQQNPPTLIIADNALVDSERVQSKLAEIDPKQLLAANVSRVVIANEAQDGWTSQICQDHFTSPNQVVFRGSRRIPKVLIELHGLETCVGVRVDSVLEGGASSQAGILAGDYIQQVGETKVLTLSDISKGLEGHKADDLLPIVILHDGKVVQKTVKVVGQEGTKIPTPWNSAYSRRNFQLGITLGQFRQMPYPDTNPKGTIAVKCSNDPNPPLELSLGKTLDGVVSCEFFDSLSPLYPSGLRLGDLNAATRFLFISRDGIEDPRLFTIITEGPAAEFGSIVRAFTAGYGTPTRSTVENFQVKAGGTFPNATFVWENDVSTIELKNFGDSTVKFSIIHALKPLLERYSVLLHRQDMEKAKTL